MGSTGTVHGNGPASDWIQRWAPLIPAGARVLDVACGAGRHARLMAARGCQVTAVDRDAAAIEALAAHGALTPVAGHQAPEIRTVIADIESGPWPLEGEQFDALIITNYLWRPLWPTLLGSLREGGVLLVETFALGHERLGRPSNPAFLLRPGELLEVAHGLHVLAFEDGLLDDPPRRIQRVAARRPQGSDVAGRGDLPLNPPR